MFRFPVKGLEAHPENKIKPIKSIYIFFIKVFYIDPRKMAIEINVDK